MYLFFHQLFSNLNTASMGKFRKLIDNNPTHLKHKHSKKLVQLFQKISSGYIYEKKNARKPNTNSIKYNLVKLGHRLKYSVYANGLTEEQRQEQSKKHNFICKEFLYDVHWYTDKKGSFYTPENVALVVESELGDRRKGDKSKMPNPAIKFDFQKLLLSNAELRLMIFKTKNLLHLEELDAYFEQAITAYTLLKKKSAFLFICFVHDTKELYYTEKYKK